jgi:hypothetical protein
MTTEATWARNVDATLITDNPARLEDYISVLGNREYSYLMNDGGVIQIAYIFDRDQIEGHRLVYFPCPFLISRRDLSPYGDAGILDLINDQLMTEIEENLLLKSPIRFDYAPGAAADYHPALHITLNDPSCRIPARAPLNFDTFMKFILENFYFDVWQSRAVIRETRLQSRGRLHARPRQGSRLSPLDASIAASAPVSGARRSHTLSPRMVAEVPL